MNDIIKIGISGNALGSGGYSNLINVGFDDVVVNRQVSFKGQTDTEYSIEVQQDANEAVFVLVANPLTVYSAGASRGGALCIFLSIPARKYMKKHKPLDLLLQILNIFREEDMIQKGDVWEYQYKAYYDSESFINLSTQVENEGLAELPTYVQMEGDSELLVSIGDKLDAFFKGDFQYPKFKECNRLVIADHINGNNWEPEIPRPWSLNVYYGSALIGKLDSSNPEISQKFPPVPSDADIYDETEIKLRLDGYGVKSTGCKVNVDWHDGKVEIKSIQWNLRQIFVPISFEGIESLTPAEIVCTIANENLNPVKKEGEVMGFDFKGLQIRAVKENMFHISNESYSFTVRLESVNGLPEGIHIIAEPKPELEQKHSNELGHVQPQNTQTPSYSATGGNPGGQNSRQDSPQGNNGGQGTFGASRQQIAGKYESGESDPQPNIQNQQPVVPETTSYTFINDIDEELCISVAVVDDKGNKVTEEAITSKKESVTKIINKAVKEVITTCKKCINGDEEPEGKPEESKLKFYRKKESWIGFALGFTLGLVLCFAAGIVYSILPKSELSNYKMPEEVTGPSLFIYKKDEIDKAVVLCNKADSLLNSANSLKHKKRKIDVSNPLKVISDQAEHFKNLLCNLEDKKYKLKFEDPAIIKNWVENERIANLNNADIDWIKQHIEYYEKIGSYLKNIISADDRTNELNKPISALFKDYNNKLDDSALKSTRMCIQVFFLSSTDSAYNDKLQIYKHKILKQEIKNGTTHYELTPQCFKDIYDKVK